MGGDHPGKLMVVGIGPGAWEQLTARAQQALHQAEVVIGYREYLDLLRTTGILAGKEVVSSGMTQELQRAAESLRRAREGAVVALVSSGDPGVYGMAGPTLELLVQSGWAIGEGPTVEVIPGVTAATAAAARLGAPLGHDFCVISLSDLLTPWPVIERRIEAAAIGDFVTVLYNPASRKRQRQLPEVQRRFLAHRSDQTPVALITEVYRSGESKILTTLALMTEHPVGMRTTVVIGNSRTRRVGEWLITPRGYGDKYELPVVS